VFLSFVISTYNRSELLKKCLNSIFNNFAFHTLGCEILIVDNNSTDNTKEVYNFFKERYGEKIKYVLEEKQGLSFCRNRGIEESKGEWLCFIDDDAVISENYIDVFYKKCLLNEALAYGGPIYLEFEKKEPVWSSKFIASIWGYFEPYKNSRYFSNEYYPRGSNMIISRRAFDKFGIFNVKLGRKGELLLGSEEKDFFSRFKKNKAKIYYEKDLIVYHYVNDFKTSLDFVKKQSIFIGLSEKIRTKEQGNVEFILKICEEFIKILISFLLFVLYLFKNYKKSFLILKVRYWILKGFFKKQML